MAQKAFFILFFRILIFFNFILFFHLFIYSLVAIDRHTCPVALFNDHFMRHPKNSVLVNVLKTAITA